MRIAFISFEDIHDPFLWSGIPFTLYSRFQASANVEVKAICSNKVKIRFPIAVLAKRFVYNKLLAYKFGVYRFDREDWCVKANSAYLNKELTDFNPDVVLCCTAYQIDQLVTDIPIFIYTDATFRLLNTYYTDYMRYCSVAVKQAERIEKTAFNKATGIIFSSGWAKQSAVIDYQIPKNKIDIVPFGSNLKLPAKYQLKLHKEISRDNFSLVFVGYDYERKGLAKAMQIHESLRSFGVNSKLTIIGPDELPLQFKTTSVNFLGKLEMKNPDHCLTLLNAYDNAHFLILPTKADCTPIVFSEAASLAIPAVTHAVGGTDEIIKNNVNGIKLSLASEPEKFADKLLFYIDNIEAYEKLRETTHEEYKKRLNWDSAVNEILALFEKSIPNKTAL